MLYTMNKCVKKLYLLAIANTNIKRNAIFTKIRMYSSYRYVGNVKKKTSNKMDIVCVSCSILVECRVKLIHK